MSLSSSFTVRAVVAADLSELARLHALCFPLDAWDVSSLAGVMAMRGAGGRLAEAQDGSYLGLLFELVNRDEAEVLTLGVHPEERRSGVARALLADLFSRAVKTGVRQVILEVAADNAGAMSLYEVCGFKIIGQRRGYYRRGSGPGIDAWLLRRSLG